MAQKPRLRPESRQETGRKTVKRARNPLKPRYEFLDSYLDEIFKSLMENEDPDTDEMPDDEQADYASDTPFDDALRADETGVEKYDGDFFFDELPQMVHIIVGGPEEVRILTHLGTGKYADTIVGDLRKWTEINRAELISMQDPGLMEKIVIDEVNASGDYREIQKNLRNLLVLLPNLQIIQLGEVYKFRREMKKETAETEIVNALAAMYRRMEPSGDFSHAGNLFRELILRRVKGVRGHAGKKWDLYVGPIRRYFEEYYCAGRNEDNYERFFERFISGSGGGSGGKGRTAREAFIMRYGEELWRILKIK